MTDTNAEHVVRDLQASLQWMTDDRDRWKAVAETFALELGKLEYARVEYANQQEHGQ